MLEKTLQEALKIVVPDAVEIEKGRRAEEILKSRLNNILEGENIDYEFVGSYARNTWLKGNLEIDVFLLFPEDYEVEELEKRGLEIGKSIVDRYELRYAAHPYVHGWVKDVEVDVVPCYKLKNPEKIKTAVDRTPFHHRWLKDKIKGKENEVRLLKGFLKAGRIYGAEYKVRGFSGYLCELLVVLYGSFLNVVTAGRKFRRDTVIDIEGKTITRGKEFTVVDPVDKKRNVAANLSLDNLARFVQRCREFYEHPSILYFIKQPYKNITNKVVRELEKRNVYCLITSKPDIVEDNLFTQLDRGCKKLFEYLSRLGFRPVRRIYFSDGKRCYLIVETEVENLSTVEKRMGPLFEDEENVKRFLEKCRSRGQKPFIEDGRFWVYAERKVKNAETAIREFATREWKAFGKDLGKTVREEFNVVSGKRIVEYCDNFEDIARFLGIIPDLGFIE
ncbi:MAG: CCA tRNA nucleotidyltransferase [Archaeoglobus sp.]|nr:MAG: CCA tRNA nucleotidyltransferase [Archaeoglobus sp.]